MCAQHRDPFQPPTEFFKGQQTTTHIQHGPAVILEQQKSVTHHIEQNRALLHDMQRHHQRLHETVQRTQESLRAMHQHQIDQHTQESMRAMARQHQQNLLNEQRAHQRMQEIHETMRSAHVRQHALFERFQEGAEKRRRQTEEKQRTSKSTNAKKSNKQPDRGFWDEVRDFFDGVTSTERIVTAKKKNDLVLGRSRRAKILANLPDTISLSENPDAAPYPTPTYSNEIDEQVNQSLNLIEKAAKRNRLDPDFVKAIIWLESTHGWMDKFVEAPKSIRPMNIYAKLWADLGLSAASLLDEEVNIEAGAFLLSSIWSRTEDPTIEKVATLYNDLAATHTSGYGKTVAIYYATKPWERVRETYAKQKPNRK